MIMQVEYSRIDSVQCHQLTEQNGKNEKWKK
jgi:hypothetical protein